MAKNTEQKLPKLIVVLGPTSSGKSALVVSLARKFKGEVISADSRQVYRDLNIGTGKITKPEMKGVPHYLLDIVNPHERFSVSEWCELAEKSIRYIEQNDRVPIVCGGTGLYISTLLGDMSIPEVPPNAVLRKRLTKKTAPQLFAMLTKLDQRRAKNIDQHNPVRLIRAIEIATALGKVPSARRRKRYDALIIGLNVPTEELKQKIEKRLKARLRSGLIAEAKRLHKNGLSYKRMRELGLDYGCLADFLQGKLTKAALFESILQANIHYAKRQMTWFKRDKEIQWFAPRETKKISQAVQNFLTS